MTVVKVLSRIGITLGCLGILFLLVGTNAVIFYFFGPVYARIGFYVPVIAIVLFIYIKKRQRGFFLEALAFIFTLFLAVAVTCDLLGIV